MEALCRALVLYYSTYFVDSVIRSLRADVQFTHVLSDEYSNCKVTHAAVIAKLVESIPLISKYNKVYGFRTRRRLSNLPQLNNELSCGR
jgi:hypothetical protein